MVRRHQYNREKNPTLYRIPRTHPSPSSIDHWFQLEALSHVYGEANLRKLAAPPKTIKANVRMWISSLDLQKACDQCLCNSNSCIRMRMPCILPRLSSKLPEHVSGRNGWQLLDKLVQLFGDDHNVWVASCQHQVPLRLWQALTISLSKYVHTVHTQQGSTRQFFSYPIAKGVSVSTMSSMHSAKCHLRVLVSEPAAGMAIVSGEKTPQNGIANMAFFRFVSLAQPEMGSQTELFIQKIGFSCAGTHLKTLADSTPWHRRKLWNVSYRKRCEWNMSSCSELCWFFVFFLAPTEATYTNVFPSSLTLKNE